MNDITIMIEKKRTNLTKCGKQYYDWIQVKDKRNGTQTLCYIWVSHGGMG